MIPTPDNTVDDLEQLKQDLASAGTTIQKELRANLINFLMEENKYHIDYTADDAVKEVDTMLKLYISTEVKRAREEAKQDLVERFTDDKYRLDYQMHGESIVSQIEATLNHPDGEE